MIKKKYIWIIVLIVLRAFGTYAQDIKTIKKASLIKQAMNKVEVPSLASQVKGGTFIPAENIAKEYNPKRRGANVTVPGKGLPNGVDPLWGKQRMSIKMKGAEPSLTFEGASGRMSPSDPTGAVGPNHYVNAWNSSFRIWDKQGTPLIDAASIATLFPGETKGDPIVMYDQFADRFIITEFTSKLGFLVAISKGPDPVNDGWYTYFFQTAVFPDYPKYSIWSDGYYITANKNDYEDPDMEVVYAIERDKMLVGDAAAQIVGFTLPELKENGFLSPMGFNVSGSELPPVGNAPIVYMQDDAWEGVDSDHLKIWNVNVNWDLPESSTISYSQQIVTSAFDGVFDGGSFTNLPQKDGVDIDAVQATIMNSPQYRRFKSYNSVVFNFVVDLDGNDDFAGIRWYELRQLADNEPWSIYQEGTYVQPDGQSAFCGTMCMDKNGSIALAYTAVSSRSYPSLRFVGRRPDDELGVMTQAEGIIFESTQADPSYRYGDYAHMTLDPVDGLTFWTIGECFDRNIRLNYVGAFKLNIVAISDMGIIGINNPSDGILSNNEDLNISLKNIGIEKKFDVPVSYQINNSTVVTEIITDTILSGSIYEYTFNESADFSTVGEVYSIKVTSNMTGDVYAGNDTLIKEVKHIYNRDISLVQIINPITGTGLTETEIISVEVKNFGAEDLSDVEVSYRLDDEDAISEVIDGTIESLDTLVYSFQTKADLFDFREYSLSVSCQIDNDEDTDNNEITTAVSNSLCTPFSDCSAGKGIYGFNMNNINHVSDCGVNGYSDNTDLIIDVDQQISNELIVTSGHGNQFFKVWIDYNDNFLFEMNEIVVYNEVLGQGSNTEDTFVDTFLIDISDDANRGEHMLRAKTNYLSGVSNNACEASDFGETEDYLVNIKYPSSSLENKAVEKSELMVWNKGDNHFVLNYETEQVDEVLIVTVHNITGQKLIQNRVLKENGCYRFNFNMSYAVPGVYLVRLGSADFGKVKRIVVK